MLAVKLYWAVTLDPWAAAAAGTLVVLTAVTVACTAEVKGLQLCLTDRVQAGSFSCYLQEHGMLPLSATEQC